MVHRRQRYADPMIWMQRNLRTWEPGAWGRPPSGPHLRQRICFGMANLPDLPWNFYNQSPSFVAEDEGTGRGVFTVCVHNCVFWGVGWVFSLVPQVFWALEIPRLGIPRPVGQELGPALWNLSDVSSNSDLLKTRIQRSMEGFRLWFLSWDFKTQAGGGRRSARQLPLVSSAFGTISGSGFWQTGLWNCLGAELFQKGWHVTHLQGSTGPRHLCDCLLFLLIPILKSLKINFKKSDRWPQILRRKRCFIICPLQEPGRPPAGFRAPEPGRGGRHCPLVAAARGAGAAPARPRGSWSCPDWSAGALLRRLLPSALSANALSIPAAPLRDPPLLFHH